MIPGFNLTYSMKNGKILPFGTQKPMQDSAAGVQNFIRKELMHVRLLFVNSCPRGEAAPALRRADAAPDSLGIRGFVRYAAEAPDPEDADPAAIMDRAEVCCPAEQWSKQWKEN